MSIISKDKLESWNEPLCVIMSGRIHSCRLLGILNGQFDRMYSHVLAVDIDNSERVYYCGKDGGASTFRVVNVFKTKTIPWTYETCPWPSYNMWLKYKGSNDIFLVNEKSKGYLNRIRWLDLYRDYLYSTDHGSSWYNCESKTPM